MIITDSDSEPKTPTETSSSHMESESTGFPLGYFVIRSVATGRLLDVRGGQTADGTEIILFPETDNSLVDNFRRPEANNQVFFIDTSGALCSRQSGHALDVEDGRLVLRHRRPIVPPYPNAWSHLLPTFSYDPRTGNISIKFATDPSYPSSPSRSNAWKEPRYLLASVPQRRLKNFIDNASEFLTSSFSAPFMLLGNNNNKSPNSRPEDIHNAGIDLDENEVLDQELGEENEVDDDPEPSRKVRVLTLYDYDLVLPPGKKKERRMWDIIPLRTQRRQTGHM